MRSVKIAELSENNIAPITPFLKVVLYVNSKMLALIKNPATSHRRPMVELDALKLIAVNSSQLRKVKSPALQARRKDLSGSFANDAARIVAGIAANSVRTVRTAIADSPGRNSVVTYSLLSGGNETKCLTAQRSRRA